MPVGSPTVLAIAEYPLTSPYTTKLIFLFSVEPSNHCTPISWFIKIISLSPGPDNNFHDNISTIFLMNVKQ
jgi:hypothetical protein